MIEKVLMQVHLMIPQIIIGIIIAILLKQMYTKLSYQFIEVHNGN